MNSPSFAGSVVSAIEFQKALDVRKRKTAPISLDGSEAGLSDEEVSTRIAFLKADNARMRIQAEHHANSSFAESISTDTKLSKLEKKLPLVEKRDPRELAEILNLDTSIEKALFAWRLEAVDGMSRLLITPNNTEFTPAELDLAGWIHTYSDQANLSFKSALAQIFEYLRRYPKALDNYTYGDADSSEFAESVSGFSLPFGWNADPKIMENFRRARVFQAGSNGCDLVTAVIAVTK
jgi:hypothetical protein